MKQVASYDNFVRVGLLKVTEVEIQPYFKTFKVKRRTYELTDAGRQYYFLDNRGSGFCFGKRMGSEITSFSEPGNNDGMTVSHVNFSYKVSDVAKWAFDPAILASAYGDAMGKSTDPSNVEKATLIKTNSGWVHEALFARR